MFRAKLILNQTEILPIGNQKRKDIKLPIQLRKITVNRTICINVKNSKIIWDKLENWLLTNIHLKLNLKECEIIFGFPNTPTAHLELINFVILMTKWYINKQRAFSNRALY